MESSRVKEFTSLGFVLVYFLFGICCYYFVYTLHIRNKVFSEFGKQGERN